MAGFFLCFGPYFLRACFSHATRLLFFFLYFVLHAFRALASSCALVSFLVVEPLTAPQPISAIFVLWEMSASLFWSAISVGITSLLALLHRLKSSFSGT